MAKKSWTKPKKAKGANGQTDAAAAELSAEVLRLQSLPPLQYETERQVAAKKLGIRVGVLDDLVKQSTPSETIKDDKMVIATDVESWPEPVEGHLLLEAISTALREHLVISTEQSDAIAFWSIYTHAFEVFRIAPRLGF